MNIFISPAIVKKLRSEKISAFVPVSATDLIWAEALADDRPTIDCSLSTQYLQNGLVHFQLWSDNSIVLAIHNELKGKDYIVWNHIFLCGYMTFHIKQNSFSIIINDILSLIATAHSASKFDLEILYRPMVSIILSEGNQRFSWVQTA